MEITQTVTESPYVPLMDTVISEYFEPPELKVSNAEITSNRTEITDRKMLEFKSLKDQSTVTTVTIGSQTDKTTHVSHERVRVERERARIPANELLRSIKIATGLTRPDTEREIRTINYGTNPDETNNICNCCLCGKTTIRPKLEVQPQIDARIAMPPAAFKPYVTKIDRPLSSSRLCSNCRGKRSQSKNLQQKYQIIRSFTRNQESYSYASSADKSYRTICRTKTIEKRDQASLAKISKQKVKDGLQTILEDPKCTESFSPSCTCYKIEQSEKKVVRKGNCYCADT
jgi:hypothetical protein